MKDKISIIVPVFNEEERIEKCLNSILNQTYQNMEIIVINDGSTDHTKDILDRINDGRLIVYHIDNHGQAYARNYGIKKATSNLITFIDSDDYVSVDMIESLYDSLIENDSDISVCHIKKVYQDKEVNFDNINYFTSDNVINMMISHPGPVARIYKKSLFTNNNIAFLEGHIYEDLATIPLIAMYSQKVSVVNKYLYFYIIRDGSTMNKKEYSQKQEDIFYVMNYLKEQFDKRSNKFYKELEYLYIEHLLYSAVMRFVMFKKDELCNKCVTLVKSNYPNWKKNIYYQKKSIKFKLFCWLSYHKMFKICHLLIKLK